ncbi:MAG: hypothetical protein EBR82_51780 [Caulobacteraceae bacterium]|nr:hypothetical protein [Caulobacteraceae bacterium]
MPINYKNYPPDWKQIRQRILARAGDKCEQCVVSNHVIGWRDYKGVFHYSRKTESGIEFKDKLGYTQKTIKIVLTIAHLDHDTTNNDESNLRAWCQRCHLSYDADLHKRNAAQTRLSKKAAGSLFAEAIQ